MDDETWYKGEVISSGLNTAYVSGKSEAGKEINFSFFGPPEILIHSSGMNITGFVVSDTRDNKNNRLYDLVTIDVRFKKPKLTTNS